MLITYEIHTPQKNQNLSKRLIMPRAVNNFEQKKIALHLRHRDSHNLYFLSASTSLERLHVDLHAWQIDLTQSQYATQVWQSFRLSGKLALGHVNLPRAGSTWRLCRRGRGRKKTQIVTISMYQNVNLFLIQNFLQLMIKLPISHTHHTTQILVPTSCSLFSRQQMFLCYQRKQILLYSRLSRQLCAYQREYFNGRSKGSDLRSRQNLPEETSLFIR